MIDLYTWNTPNGFKASIMLEELGLPYSVHPVNIVKREQFAPDFLKISPNNKIPAIVDQETGQSVFESGAILIYLAEKTGSSLLPASGPARAATLEWLMFQMASIGPMFGQYNHFTVYAKEKVPYGVTRYTDEVKRIFGVMEKRLAETPYLAGDYSIADIASFAWSRSVHKRVTKDDAAFPDATPHVRGWLERVGARDAVQRGLTVPNV
ncbi:MAG: glutathione S-transferase N-terminal domain-containing protein [Pseudomonadota bacterium]